MLKCSSNLNFMFVERLKAKTSGDRKKKFQYRWLRAWLHLKMLLYIDKCVRLQSNDRCTGARSTIFNQFADQVMPSQLCMIRFDFHAQVKMKNTHTILPWSKSNP